MIMLVNVGTFSWSTCNLAAFHDENPFLGLL
jgi:hypothetical protein